jgi:hypothetical protein
LKTEPEMSDRPVAYAEIQKSLAILMRLIVIKAPESILNVAFKKTLRLAGEEIFLADYESFVLQIVSNLSLLGSRNLVFLRDSAEAAIDPSTREAVTSLANSFPENVKPQLLRILTRYANAMVQMTLNLEKQQRLTPVYLPLSHVFESLFSVGSVSRRLGKENLRVLSSAMESLYAMAAGISLGVDAGFAYPYWSALVSSNGAPQVAAFLEEAQKTAAAIEAQGYVDPTELAALYNSMSLFAEKARAALIAGEGGFNQAEGALEFQFANFAASIDALAPALLDRQFTPDELYALYNQPASERTSVAIQTDMSIQDQKVCVARNGLHELAEKYVLFCGQVTSENKSVAARWFSQIQPLANQ